MNLQRDFIVDRPNRIGGLKPADYAGQSSPKYHLRMSDTEPRLDARPSQTQDSSRTTSIAKPSPKSDAVVCERCGVEMFRMHAVWRCPGCGFKTDCCGW